MAAVFSVTALGVTVSLVATVVKQNKEATRTVASTWCTKPEAVEKGQPDLGNGHPYNPKVVVVERMRGIGFRGEVWVETTGWICATA